MVFLLSLAISAVLSSPIQDPFDNGTKLVSAKDAPNSAALAGRFEVDVRCSPTMLNHRYAISAAHCFIHRKSFSFVDLVKKLKISRSDQQKVSQWTKGVGRSDKNAMSAEEYEERSEVILRNLKSVPVFAQKKAFFVIHSKVFVSVGQNVVLKKLPETIVIYREVLSKEKAVIHAGGVSFKVKDYFYPEQYLVKSEKDVANDTLYDVAVIEVEERKRKGQPSRWKGVQYTLPSKDLCRELSKKKDLEILKQSRAIYTSSNIDELSNTFNGLLDRISLAVPSQKRTFMSFKNSFPKFHKKDAAGRTYRFLDRALSSKIKAFDRKFELAFGRVRSSLAPELQLAVGSFRNSLNLNGMSVSQTRYYDLPGGILNEPSLEMNRLLGTNYYGDSGSGLAVILKNKNMGPVLVGVASKVDSFPLRPSDWSGWDTFRTIESVKKRANKNHKTNIPRKFRDLSKIKKQFLKRKVPQNTYVNLCQEHARSFLEGHFDGKFYSKAGENDI